MAKNYNTRIIKTRKSYSPEEIASLFNINRRTVTTWIGKGLQVIDKKSKPYLIMGFDLAGFLRCNMAKRRVRLEDNQYFCLKCRKAVEVRVGSESKIKTGKRIGADNREQFKKVGNCRCCGTKVSRFL